MSPKVFVLQTVLLFSFTSDIWSADEFAESVQPFISSHCIHCHDSGTETGLDLEALKFNLSDADAFASWERVFDRARLGEMPPATEPRPEEGEVQRVLDILSEHLHTASFEHQAKTGRVPARRLTKTELNYTLRDLLRVDGDLVAEVPDETDSGSFDTVGVTQRISSVHLQSILSAADRALDMAIQLGEDPYFDHSTSYAWLKPWHEKPLQLGGSVTRKLESGKGIALFRDLDYLTGFQFRGNPFGGVPVRGNYRLTCEVAAIQSRESMTAKVLVKDPSGAARLAKAFEVEPGEPQTVSFETFLNAGEIVYLTFREKTPSGVFAAGGAKHYKGPGLAIHAQRVEGPLHATWPPPSSQSLLGEVGLEKRSTVRQALNRIMGSGGNRFGLAEGDPSQAIHAIVQSFAPRALRRPVDEEEVREFVDLAKPALEAERPVLDAVRIPLRSILCSPQFLVFESEAGPLGEYPLANRLSYFLWKSMPDERLFELAQQGKLSNEGVLRDEVERMLDDPKGMRFVEDFVGQWLRLHQVDATTPDEGLYPEFDETLAAAIPRETELFFAELIRENLSLTNLIDADFTMLNARLAEHYEIEGVHGQEFQRFTLPHDSVRGGILTQAAILKTTANGTNTSPVARGNFVLTSLLGMPPAPPPPNIGAIEPDTRGQTTIREILAAHREMESCNLCHRLIDPPGFALESFDPVGGFRTHYRISGGEAEFNGFVTKLPPKQGLPVDASGVAVSGREFSGISEFKQILLEEKEQVARNFVSQLVVYATGAEIQFADRREVESIVKQASAKDFLVRDLLHAVVQSRLFRHN